MKNNSRFRFFLLLVLSLLVGLGITYPARQEGQSKPALDFSDLSFEITVLNKSDFVRLEPIPIRLMLSNKTDQPILGHGALKFSDNLVKIYVAEEGGEYAQVPELAAFTKEISVKPWEIKPGNSVRVNQLLALNLDKVFRKVGNYQLFALLTDPTSKQQIKSNTTSISVLEPDGMDRQAFEFLRKNFKSANLLSGHDVAGNPHLQELLERFARIFEKTAYGDYAAFVLGELYFAQDDYKRASEQFNKLASKDTFVFADKAKKYLGDANEKPPE